MKNGNIIYITRPISPPWDEGSKNLAYLLAKNISNYTINLLSNKNGKYDDINLIKVYKNKDSNIGLAERLRLLKFLYFTDKNDKIFHNFFVPTKINSGLIRKILKKNCYVIQNVVSCFHLNKITSEKKAKKLLFGNKVIVISEKAAEICKRFNIDFERILPPIDTNKFSISNTSLEKLRENLKLKENDFVLFFSGDYSQEKAIRDLIDAVDIVKKRNYNIKVVSACRLKRKKDIKIETKLREYIDTKRLSNNFVILNFIEDIENLLASCDAGVFPLREQYSKYDYPIVLLELMALGKPIIIGDISPYNELVENNRGLSYKAGSVHDFAEKIISLIENKNLYKKLSKNARDFIKRNCDINVISKKYEKIYSELLNAKNIE